MKKAMPLFFLVMIVLSGCNQSFYNTRHHAHRDYVKIGPGMKYEQVTQNENSFVKVKGHVEKQVIQNVKMISLESKNFSNKRLKSSPISNKIKSSKVVIPKSTKSQKLFKKEIQKPRAKGAKEGGAGVVVNILGFSFGLISVIMVIVSLFILLFSIAFPYLGPIAISVIIAGFCVGGAAIILGAFGLGFKLPKKGFAIAGIAMGGAAIFIGLIAMALYFVFL